MLAEPVLDVIRGNYGSPDRDPPLHAPGLLRRRRFEHHAQAAGTGSGMSTRRDSY
jgi:hypothetical protein